MQRLLGPGGGGVKTMFLLELRFRMFGPRA